MAFVPAPNIVMVELRCTLDGQNIENRWMFNALTTPTPGIVAEITNLVSVWAQNAYFDWLPNAVQLREVVGTDMSVQNGVQHTITPEAAVLGGLIGEAMPNEVTLCVSLRTGVRGRSARGRTYVLALVEQHVTQNTVAQVLIDAQVATFQALIDTMTTNGRPMAIVSYRSNNAPRVGGPVYFLVETAVVTDSIVDSMRRRKPGVGT